MSQKEGKEKEGLFSNFFKFLGISSWFSPAAQKQIKELSSPSRPDWRKQTNEVWMRSLEQLPLDVDLTRLAARVSIEDHRTCDASLLLPPDPNELEGDPIMQKPERNPSVIRNRPIGTAADQQAMSAALQEASRRSYRAVRELLYEIMFVFAGPEKAEAAKNRFMTEFPLDTDITVQKAAFKAYLVSEFGENTPSGRCLKSINQAIIAPGNKEALINLLPGATFKDSQQRPWEVVVRVFDDHTEVSHLRFQSSLPNRKDISFSFLLETAFVFDKDLQTMTDVNLYVDEYSFGPETTAAAKAQFTPLFDAHLRPVTTGPIPPVRVTSNIGRRVTNFINVHVKKGEESTTTTTTTTTGEKAEASSQ